MADYLHPDSIENKLGLGRVPEEPQEGIVWRGMSGGEFKNLLRQGFLESKGEYNIGEIQKGLTIFSSDPRMAEMYAHDFAPRDFKATPESSAYVVGIRKPSGAIPQSHKRDTEFGVRGQIPIEDIVSVYRGNVFRPKSDKNRAVLDWQKIPLTDITGDPYLERARDYVDFEKVPAVIDAAAEASRLALPPDDEPRSKGLRKGIGSLKRAPWFALAQMAWEHLSPEQKEAAAQYGKEAYGSLENAWEAASAWSGRNRFPAGGEGGLQWVMDHLGFEKSGLASLKKELGISDDDMPGLGHNQGPPLDEETPFTVHKGGKRATKPLFDLKDDVAVSQSTIKRRLRSAKDELSDIIGMPLKRISTEAVDWLGRDVPSRVAERVQRRMDKLGKNDPLLAKRMDRLWAEIMELKPLVDPDTRFGPSWRTDPVGKESDLMHDPTNPLVVLDDLTRNIKGVPTKKQEGTLYEALNSLPGHIRGYTGEISPDEYSIAKALSRLSPDAIRAADRFLKLRDGKGLLDHTFPQTQTDTIIKVDPDLPRTDQETVQNRIRNILDPESQSYIKLVDEEPPDTGMAYGGFVDNPLGANLSNVSFDTGTQDGDPDSHEEAADFPTVDNTYGLSVIGGLATLAGLPISLLTTPVAAYHTLSDYFGGKDPEPQYTGPVNPQTHEIGEIDVTEEEAGFAVGPFGQAQVSLAPAQGAESELGNPPAPTVDPFGGVGAPPSGSDGAGDGTGEGAASAAADSPAGSPWHLGGFVVKPLYDS